ncbi:MAG: hypothetical protein HC881_00985 [Leptolyngbyaceae cyanobacterium SL_7_1]|nr:hypothetical protein [Leptolyngbyaceae cyanobacterium SL_7_1]
MRYRIGDYTSVRDRLLDRLTCAIVTADFPQGISLRKLNTRTNDDPAIALLDACAVVADVLTFYQERIINEGYLMTATERRSVLELARMIGYELHPGVAASTLLAFTVEDAPDAPKTAAIAQGTQILSIPEQDEVPQTFETSTEFIAQVEWNALKPRPARPLKITPTTQQLFLQGTNTGLQPGDPLLLMDGEDASKPYYLLTIDRVEPNPAHGYTLIGWQPQTLALPPRQPIAITFRQRANLFGFNAPRWESVADAIKLATGSKIKGGVYRLAEAPERRWESVNTGLLTFDVRCLAVTASGTLLAGTPSGIFRSKDNGNTWGLANTGLTNFAIQTIFAADHLWVGTPGGGVFHSTDDGETWSPIGIGSITVETTSAAGVQTSKPKNTGIPNTVVRTIALYRFTFDSPTLSSDGTTVRITSGERTIPLNLQIGDVLWVRHQARSISAITSPTEVTINAAFRNPPPPDADGAEINLPGGTVFTAFRPGSSPDQPPIVLTDAAGDFLLAGTDIGIYRSTNQGKDWSNTDNLGEKAIRSLVVCPGFVFARTEDGIHQSPGESKAWTLKNPTNVDRIRSLVAFGNDAFVAASDGVWRSRSGGDWAAVTTGLTDRQVWSIAINANGTLFALTEGGVFRSDNQGDRWDLWSAASANPDLTAVVACAKSGAASSIFLFAGAKFTGFEAVGEEGWAAFHLPSPSPGEGWQIDLSAPYPTLLEGSWLLLQSGDRHHHQLCTIQSIAEVQRQAFTLDSKISRLFTDTAIAEPQRFNLRESIGLVQSQALPLMDEPLTVALQQANIFFDPIWQNQVLLSQYVAGLQAQHPVIVSGKRIRAELLNVGGIVQQIPQVSDSTIPWQRRNDGVTNTSVTALTAHTSPEAGTLSSDATALRGNGTRFTEELRVGMTLTVGGSDRPIAAIYSDTSLTVNAPFDAVLESPTNFTYSGNGSGSIASKDTRVSGHMSQFKQELKPGVTIVVGEQTRLITAIDSDTALTLESAFDPTLPPGTAFTYEAQGTGTINNDRTAIRGMGTAFTTTLQPGQAITIDGLTYRIEQLVSDNLLFLDADVALTSAVFGSNTLVVGTMGGGVFRSIDNGETWEGINQGLPSLTIQAIAVRSTLTKTNSIAINCLWEPDRGVSNQSHRPPRPASAVATRQRQSSLPGCSRPAASAAHPGQSHWIDVGRDD